MVLEYAQEGSLLNFLKNKIGRDEKRKIFAGITEGVGYLHGKGIAHRDLKLENVLVFKESGEIRVKLADFGFATKVKKN
jgi:serine/threonine protein kinase